MFYLRSYIPSNVSSATIYALWVVSKMPVQVTEQYECHIRYHPLSVMSLHMSDIHYFII